METNKEAVRAVENGLLAVDTSIRNLVLARTLLEQELEKLRQGTPGQPNPMATFGEPEPEGGAPCEHLDVQERSTMGQSWFLCSDCKEMVEP